MYFKFKVWFIKSEDDEFTFSLYEPLRDPTLPLKQKILHIQFQNRCPPPLHFYVHVLCLMSKSQFVLKETIYFISALAPNICSRNHGFHNFVRSIIAYHDYTVCLLDVYEWICFRKLHKSLWVWPHPHTGPRGLVSM